MLHDHATRSNRLHDAFRRAHQLLEQPLQLPARLVVRDAAAFRADVTPADGRIEVSTGVVAELDALWSLLWDTPVLRIEDGAERASPDDRGVVSASDYADNSLVWLLLHEMMHVRLGHHRFLRCAGLVEIGSPGEADTVPDPAIIAVLDASEMPLVRPCLELQADSDAMDLLVGPYSPTRHAAMRVHAVCLFAVVILIERENRRLGNRNVTHPSAATRLFMLLGSLLMAWGQADASPELRADGFRYLPNSQLSLDRFDVFVAGVLRPLIDDVAVVVTAAGTRRLATDIHGPLLADLPAAYFMKVPTLSAFRSKAAKDWLRLARLNGRLLQVMGRV